MLTRRIIRLYNGKRAKKSILRGGNMNKKLIRFLTDCMTIHRLDRNMSVYIETWPDLPDGGEAVVNTLTAEKEYRIPLQLA